MLSVAVLCVGKLKERYWRESIGEYAKRLTPFCKFSVIEIEESRVPEKASNLQIASALTQEGKRILAKIPQSALVAGLCIEGKALSSEQLSETIAQAAVGGKSSIVFIIGGSWGLSDEVKTACDLKLSMSKMTFPHQLARVMLCEQIYRAFQIAEGSKYHK